MKIVPTPARRILQALAIFALVTSTMLGSKALWISGKAVLAQYLLDIAWQQSRQSGKMQKPWSWADVATVARLEVPSLGDSLIVLNDASGEALAFGPGLVGGDLSAAGNSTIAIGGHRDTHLAFLEHLPMGTRVDLETLDGQLYRYELADMHIVDTRFQSLQIAANQPGLVLITCYPFDPTQTGGPLRLVATATRVNGRR